MASKERVKGVISPSSKTPGDLERKFACPVCECAFVARPEDTLLAGCQPYAAVAVIKGPAPEEFGGASLLTVTVSTMCPQCGTRMSVVEQQKLM